MNGGDLRWEVDPRGVGRIELARPGVRNAFDGRMWQTLREVLLEAARRDDVWVVLLRGQGPVFCAGGHVGWMAELAAGSASDRLHAARQIVDVFQAIRQCPQPVVCGVQGAAIGGGTGLAAAADYVLATADVQFGLSEARLGLVAACVAPFLIARVGEGNARRLLLTGERVGADEALQTGLIDAVAPDLLALEAAQEARLAQMLACAPQALARAKRLLAELSPSRQSLFSEESLERAVQAMADAWASPEGREGLAAYLEKRPPSWRVARRE